MIELRSIDPDDWRIWRDLRLEALACAPDAFGSRLADWQDAEEGRWRDRLSFAGRNFVAFLDDKPAGMVSGVLGDEPGVAVLISMYVSPFARGRGIGDSLITAVLDWAREQGAESVHLDVVVGNEPAATLYARHGFAFTGRAPADSPGERTMIRPVR